MARVSATFWRLRKGARALAVCSVGIAAGLIVDQVQSGDRRVSLPFLVVTLTVLGVWARAEKRHRPSAHG